LLRRGAQKKQGSLPSINKISPSDKENPQKNANPDKMPPSKDGKGLACGGLVIQGKGNQAPPVTPTEQEGWEAKPLSLPDSIKDNEELRSFAKNIQRDIVTKNPAVKFDHIIGLDNCKRIVKEALLFPLKYADLFERGMIDPWSGVLFFGPSGTGKTHLAKAVATECGTTFFNISASSVISKYHGESEKMVRVLFELARHSAPSTIFLDEIDSIMTKRTAESGQHEASRRLKTELLIQMDGLLSSSAQGSPRVFVIAASNTPWDLDEAFLRRLEKRVR
jgi:katanin p60 ATPase-containing subunit A1